MEDFMISTGSAALLRGRLRIVHTIFCQLYTRVAMVSSCNQGNTLCVPNISISRNTTKQMLTPWRQGGRLSAMSKKGGLQIIGLVLDYAMLSPASANAACKGYAAVFITLLLCDWAMVMSMAVVMDVPRCCYGYVGCELVVMVVGVVYVPPRCPEL